MYIYLYRYYLFCHLFVADGFTLSSCNLNGQAPISIQYLNGTSSTSCVKVSEGYMQVVCSSSSSVSTTFHSPLTPT